MEEGWAAVGGEGAGEGTAEGRGGWAGEGTGQWRLRQVAGGIGTASQQY